MLQKGMVDNGNIGFSAVKTSSPSFRSSSVFCSLTCEKGRYLILDINKIMDLISIGHILNGTDRCSRDKGFNIP